MKSNSLDNLKISNTRKVSCVFCGIKTTVANHTKHEKTCMQNPVNLRPCPACGKMFSSKTAATCSYACSNTHFAKARNKPERYKNHRTICFKNHEKKCIVCSEKNIVEVHHIDENHKNNDPKNLVPLCPTHHQYVHSRYKDEILPIIQKYICA